jgi:hypothetical protein
MTATKTVESASFAGVFDAEQQDDISDMYVEDSTVVKGYRVVRQQGRTFGSYFTEEPTEADIRRVKAMWAELIAKNAEAGLPVTTVSSVTREPSYSYSGGYQGHCYDSYDDDGGRYGGGYADYTVWK